jgi:hypothetical protein
LGKDYGTATGLTADEASACQGAISLRHGDGTYLQEGSQGPDWRQVLAGEKRTLEYGEADLISDLPVERSGIIVAQLNAGKVHTGTDSLDMASNIVYDATITSADCQYCY